MKDSLKDRYPSYVPAYYRTFCLLRKIYRQTIVRIAEARAAKQGPMGIIPDENPRWSEPKEGPIENPKEMINKAAFWIDEDMQLDEIKKISNAIDTLKAKLDSKGLLYTTTAATFLKRMFYPRTEKTKLWENTWTLAHSDIQPGERVLDIGGASTIFVYYLASLGCSVRCIDNDWNNCGIIYNNNYVAKQMNWDLRAIDRDISKPLPFPDNYFDKAFSICVIEHLPSVLRRYMMKEVGRVIKPQGLVALTTDYDHKRKVLLSDKGLRFAYRGKLEDDIIKPSGLKLHGNTEFIDAFENENFLGAFFLKKS